MVLQHQLVGCDTHMEGIGLGPALPLELPLFLGSIVSKDFKAGAPTFQLHLPVQHHAGGDNDQMGTPVTFLTGQVGKQGNGLDGLA